VNKKNNNMSQTPLFKKLLQYFLQGLLVLAPILITVYAVYWVVISIDTLLPIFTFVDEKGNVSVQNFGLGFLLIISTITIVGYLSTFFIRSRIFNFFEAWLEKVPGIKFIYGTSKDFFEAFAGEKKKFNKPVLANIDDNDVWRIGFLTQESMEQFGMKEYVSVYIPMSYSIAGNVYFIPASRIKELDPDISAAEAMKFAISGGVTTVDEHDE
jgi:uncharacterized membrane protein